MNRESAGTSELRQGAGSLAARVNRVVRGALHIVLSLGLLGALYEQHWFNVLLVLGIMLLMLVPAALRGRFRIVDIPAEFEVLAVVFVFASVFLGEVRGYYERIWWWDIALHTSSGLLL